MKKLPDARGYFGEYGGKFVPETLMAPLAELEESYHKASRDRGFQARLDELLTHYVGRPTPLYQARRLSAHLGGARIWLKREDLCHTGAHKINNALGQALLAREMGKGRVIAETGAGQHGVAVATAAALLGLECRVYMGSEDMRRQALNVVRMQLHGRRGGRGGSGLVHPQGCDQRGVARLGHQCSHHPLHPRFGARSPPLSDDGAGFPDGDRA